MTSIEVQDLVLQRASGFRLGPLDLRLEHGTRNALVGPSGCGKTTLLRCLAGLLEPDAGTIRFGDRVVTAPGTAVPPSERRIGFVFQDGALWPHLTAVDHLRFADPGLSRAGALARLDQVGLAGAADRRPGRLSGGEGRRLELARALAGDPDLLLLDEPLHSVDVHLRSSLGLLVRRLADQHGLTLVVVTHDRDEALAMADELVVLRDGHLVEAGSAASLLRRPRTAFCATFLGRAACLPARARADGRVDTVFGVLEAPARPTGEVALVVLPGDVGVPARVNGTHPRGRVLQVLPSGPGSVATVELDGTTLQVPCDPAIAAGAELPLELRGAPRILPAEVGDEP